MSNFRPYLTMIKIFQLTNSFPFCLLNLKITHELSIKLLPINRSKEHSSWTSGIGNFLQTLDINLGNVHKLTSIDTFGRQLSNEFVSEYRLLASDDGVYWRMYLINGVEKAIFFSLFLIFSLSFSEFIKTLVNVNF